MKRLLLVFLVIVLMLVFMLGLVTSDYKGGNSKMWEHLPTKDFIGKATWYGIGEFLGNRTPSGILCDGRTPQAAHRTLPFGIVVEVFTMDHDWDEKERSIRVIITDRGPYVDGRVIDLNAKWTMNQLCGKSCGMADVGIAIVDDTYACTKFRCLSKHFGKMLEEHEIKKLGLTWPPR